MPGDIQLPRSEIHLRISRAGEGFRRMRRVQIRSTPEARETRGSLVRAVFYATDSPV